MAILCLPAASPAGSAGAKSVEVVISQRAGSLERFAASELKRYLAELFGVSASVVGSPSAAANHLFLLGTASDSPGRTPIPGPLPRLSEQGFLLRTATCGQKPALVIIGGSPAAAMWGVYELVERYGVRYLLSGDVVPEKRQSFFLPRIDQVFEPALRVRWWRTMGDFAMGTEGWGLADYRPLIDQLAKLKFNRIRVGSGPSQPFLHLNMGGIRQRFATLWYGARYPITADMPGRELFGNDKEFWNPDLPLPDAGYEKLAAAGRRHCHRLIAYAQGRGMQASFVGSVTDFPREFAAIVPGAQTVNQLGQLTVGPGPGVRPDNADLLKLSGTVIRTIIDTYPEADSYGFPVGTEWRSWTDLYAWAWRELDRRYGVGQAASLEAVLGQAGRRTDYPDGAERALREVKGDITGLYFLTRLWTSPDVLPRSRKPQAKLVVYQPAEELFPILSRVLPKGAELLIGYDYTAVGMLRRRWVLGTVPAREIPAILDLPLHEDNIGVLPQLRTDSLHELVGDICRHGLAGFYTRHWMISDLDPCVAYLSRAAWDPGVTPRAVYADQVEHACGAAAVGPMLEAFRELDAVTTALERYDLGLAFPVEGMIMKHWAAEPFSPQHAQDRQGYWRALAAVRSVPRVPRPEGAAYVRYWAGRLAFGIGYFDAIEAVKHAAAAQRAADQARQKGDRAAHRARLAEAVAHTQAAKAAAFQAIATLARVAKNRADHGAVATMAEYVYRPLAQKLVQLRHEFEQAGPQ
jgi:hypothetical protein